MICQIQQIKDQQLLAVQQKLFNARQNHPHNVSRNWFLLKNSKEHRTPFSYILLICGKASYCIQIFLTIHKFLSLLVTSLQNVINEEIKIIHFYNIHANIGLTDKSKMHDFVLKHVSNKIHNFVSKVYTMAFVDNVFIILPFVIHCLLSNIYEENKTINLQVMYGHVDYNVPVNSVDMVEYFDIIWGNIDDMYFCKWGKRILWDEWLISIQMNHLGLQFAQYLCQRLEEILHEIEKHTTFTSNSSSSKPMV